jgi:hypothetical protein
MDSAMNALAKQSLRITALQRAMHSSPRPHESDSHKEWRSSSPLHPDLHSIRENTTESTAPKLGADQKRAIIFLARALSAARAESVWKTEKWLREACALMRAQWIKESGPLKTRSIRIPLVQSATRKLIPKCLRQLRLFTTRNNQGCDIVISGFDGLLTNAPGLKGIFQVDREQLDLGLIVYLSMENTFTRVDIQKIIQVWDGSMDESTLDGFSQQFFTKAQR